MDFTKIVSQTWQIVSKRPYLWLVGLLAGSSFLSGFFVNIYGLGGGGANRVLADSSDFSSWAIEFIQSNWLLILIVLIILGLINFILFVLSFAARAGLIRNVFDLESSRTERDFFSTIAIGFEYFWPVFLLTMLFGLAVVIVAVVILLPFLLDIFFPIFIIGWAFISIFLIFVLVVFAELIYLLALRGLVIESYGVGRSLRDSWQLFKKELSQLILAVLVFWLISIIFTTLISMFVLTYFLVAGLFFWLTYIISIDISVLVAIFLSLVLIVFVLVMVGFVSSFRITYWTLVYNRIKRNNSK
jgi:hypothetical protein